MESNELIKIWKTLAENKLIEKNLAKENILQLITKKGAGLLEKLEHKVKKEIILDIITSGLVACIITGVYIFQSAQNIEKKAHIILFIILLYFIFKLYRDVRKYKLLQVNKLTDSIKNFTFHSYNKFKSQLKQDIIVAISFIVTVNLYVIYIYYKAFGNINMIDFTHINGQVIGFILLILLVLFVMIAPWVLKYFFNNKYQLVINDFESMMKELNSENE